MHVPLFLSLEIIIKAKQNPLKDFKGIENFTARKPRVNQINQAKIMECENIDYLLHFVYLSMPLCEITSWDFLLMGQC